MSYISPALNFVISAVKKAGNGLTRDFNEIERLQASVKNNNSFIASAYSRVESLLKVELAKSRPQFAYYEAGKAIPNVPCFAISPVDGIVNFANGMPYFAISVATIENSVVTSAVIYNPVADEMFFAEKGNGAFKEGFRSHERLRVSGVKEINDALVSVSKGVTFANKFENVRLCGSTALDLAYVAAGRFDAAVSTGNDLSSIAAGLLLVKEAGGTLLELNQKDIRTEDMSAVMVSGNVIAVNPNLSKKVHELANN